MAFSKRNILERIVEIQNITLEHKGKGYTQAWIYRNVVKSRFYISESTFKNYMCRNAKRELRELGISG